MTETRHQPSTPNPGKLVVANDGLSVCTGAFCSGYIKFHQEAKAAIYDIHVKVICGQYKCLCVLSGVRNG